jgi:hypothetical protein
VKGQSQRQVERGGGAALLWERGECLPIKLGFTFCSETGFDSFRFPRDSKFSSIGVFMIYERQNSIMSQWVLSLLLG